MYRYLEQLFAVFHFLYQFMFVALININNHMCVCMLYNILCTVHLQRRYLFKSIYEPLLACIMLRTCFCRHYALIYIQTYLYAYLCMYICFFLFLTTCRFSFCVRVLPYVFGKLVSMVLSLHIPINLMR